MTAENPPLGDGRVYLLDESGALRQVFDNAELAHACAHEQVQVPPVRGRWPERREVFDPASRTSRFVDGGGCFEVRWLAVGKAGLCPVPAVAVPYCGVPWQAGGRP